MSESRGDLLSIFVSICGVPSMMPSNSSSCRSHGMSGVACACQARGKKRHIGHVIHHAHKPVHKSYHISLVLYPCGSRRTYGWVAEQAGEPAEQVHEGVEDLLLLVEGRDLGHEQQHVHALTQEVRLGPRQLGGTARGEER